MKAAANPSNQSHQCKATSVAQHPSSKAVSLEPPETELFTFEDKRPEAVAQRQLQVLADGSPQVRKAAQLQAMVNNSPRMAAQRQRRENVLQRVSAVIQFHKGKNEFDTTEDDMLIYAVKKKSTDAVVYVGQTEESVGLEKRFEQHLGVHTTWSKSTHKIVKLEAGTWTRFETSCAEQYWIDRHGGTTKLENARNQISKSHFEEMIKWQKETGTIVFRGEDANFPKGWKPLN